MSTGGSGNYRETELMTPYLRNSQGSEKREVLAAVTNTIGVIVFTYFHFLLRFGFCFSCVCGVHVCTCVGACVWVQMHMCLSPCGDQRFVLDLVHHHSSPLFTEMGYGSQTWSLLTWLVLPTGLLRVPLSLSSQA